MRFYFLTGRRSCSRYHELHPGITDRADVQKEIIDSIIDRGVRCVILWKSGWPDSVLDKIKAGNMARLEGVGAEILNDFIAVEFEPLAQFGEDVLMWRRGTARPEGW